MRHVLGFPASIGVKREWSLPRHAALMLIVLAISGCQTPVPPVKSIGSAPTSSSASVRLDRLATEARERELDLFPIAETLDIGAGPRQGRLELDFTAEHRERQRAHHRWILARLTEIPLADLQSSEQLTHRLLRYQSQLQLEALAHPLHQYYLFIPLDGGVGNDLIRLINRQPLRNESDYRAWMTRLRRYPLFMDSAAGVMREGIEAGVTLPGVVVERTLAQLDSLAKDERELASNPLWKPMMQFPQSIDANGRALIEAEYRQLLTADVLPAVRRLASFVRDAYLPRARTTAGLGAIPGGDAMYRYLMRESTTTDMTADQIHELGIAEVRRIQAELRAAALKAGFTGAVKDLRAWLRGNPENYPFTSGESVVEYLNGINARIVPQLPRLFGRLPKARLEIRLTDPALAASVAAQWYPPSDDGTQPGIFAIPIVDARKRALLGLPSLLAHEGMPGHHLEGSLTRERQGLPEYRRRLWINAFSEGWALYAESLGHELGLYAQPLELMGRYVTELYRAGRLVADTGIHAKSWSRAMAIRFMTEECALEPTFAESEVDRYMAWPGQALGYKIGELTILEIREKAEGRLGERFDIRRFHDVMLEEGQLPLSLLRERMNSWIEDGAMP